MEDGELTAGDAEELAAKVKEEGKGDDVIRAVKEALDKLPEEKREALRELLRKLEGERDGPKRQ